MQWVKSRGLRQCLAKGSKVEKEGDGSAPRVSFSVASLAFFLSHIVIVLLTSLPLGCERLGPLFTPAPGTW